MAEAPVMTDPFTEASRSAENSHQGDDHQGCDRPDARKSWSGRSTRPSSTATFRYSPRKSAIPFPLLLVFALMNRPYILDLRPGHSFVEYMVNQGYDLYLLDWGAPGPEDKNLKFDDYTLDYMPRAIRKMKAISGVKEFSLLGWCIGAILTTIYSALRGGRWLAQPDSADRSSGLFQQAGPDLRALDRRALLRYRQSAGRVSATCRAR